MVISQPRAYIAGGSSGFQLVDITNPQSPQLMGSVDTPGNAESVAISGIYAYVADRSSGLQVIDISNPQNPQIVGNVSLPGNAVGVVISDSHAYVILDAGSSLQVIDLSNPASPQIVGSVELPEGALDLTVSGSYVYVAARVAGAQVIDVTDPTTPQIVGGVMMIATPSSIGLANNVAVSSNYAYVTESGKFSVVPAQCPQITAVEPVEVPGVVAGSLPFTLAQNRPNPFVAGSGPTAIAFDLRDGARTKLRVFDLTGRVVRVLMDEAIGAGPHMVSWDGRTDAGDEAASGTYYYCLEVGEFRESRALVKLR